MTDDKAAARREYYRQWRERNREYVREFDRRRNVGERKRQGLERIRDWREANPERVQEGRRRYREANAEKIRAGIRRWREANRDHVRAVDRQWNEANRDRVRETGRRAQQARRARGYVVPSRVRRREMTAALWQEQDGRCYLCVESVPLGVAVLDHDHRCCPLDAFCLNCIRGVACNNCNTAIGLLGDNPDLLERVAWNLRASMAEVDERASSKPEQLTLD